MPRERKPCGGSVGTGTQSFVQEDEEPGDQRSRVAIRISPAHQRRVPHISLVFREIWDSTELYRPLSTVQELQWKICGIPHLAKNEREMGHPSLVGRTEFIKAMVGLRPSFSAQVRWCEPGASVQPAQSCLFPSPLRLEKVWIAP